MRTTVTLDKDVERILRHAMRATHQSFKAVLNDAVRRGLKTSTPLTERTPFVVKARPMSLREGIDPASFNRLADELEMATPPSTRQLERGGKSVFPDQSRSDWLRL
jgi:hypothetical protein